jgi:transcriptional regulator with XRE-family HTH domain
MNKTDAIALFGKTQQALADALGLTRPAISQWPEELRQEQIDRVVGAAVRLGCWPPPEDAKEAAGDQLGAPQG